MNISEEEFIAAVHAAADDFGAPDLESEVRGVLDGMKRRDPQVTLW